MENLLNREPFSYFFNQINGKQKMSSIKYSLFTIIFTSQVYGSRYFYTWLVERMAYTNTYKQLQPVVILTP